MEVTANVSRAVSKDNKIKVVFGDGAYTNGDTITLPSLPAEKSLSYNEQMVMQGYRDHETMHILCSNLTPKSKNELAKLSEAERSALNGLEDIRIERCAAQAYIGMRQNIQAVNASLGEKLKEQLGGKNPTENMSPLDYGVMILMAKAREEQGYGKDFFSEVYETASPEWKAFADKWAKKINAVPTGWNGKEINRRKALDGFKEVKEMVPDFLQDMKETLKQDIEQTQQQSMQVPSSQPTSSSKKKIISIPLPTGGQGNGSGSSNNEEIEQQQGEGGNGGNAKGQDKQGPQQGQGQGGDSSSDSPSSSGSGNSSAPGFGKPRELTDDDLVNGGQRYDKEKNMKEMVNDIADTAKSTLSDPFNFENYSWLGQYALVSPPFYRKDDGEECKGGYDKLKETFNAFIDNSKQDIIRAKRGLEIALQARSDTDMESGFRHGGFDSKRVVHAINGNPYVFRQRKDGKDMDTIVTFLVDCSGSMNACEKTVNYPHDEEYDYNLRRRMAIACRTAYILCKACESVGAKTEVVLFDDNPAYVEQINGSYFAEPVNLYVTQVKAGKVNPTWLTDILLKGSSNPKLRAKVHELSTFKHPLDLNTKGACKYRSLLLLKDKQRRCDEPYSQAGFVYGTNRDDGNTPIGESIEVCLHRLVKSPEKKKILAVLTDGDMGTEYSTLIRNRLQSFADAHDINMLGIGIGVDDVTYLKEAFRNLVITSGGDLGRDLLNRIAQMIKED